MVFTSRVSLLAARLFQRQKTDLPPVREHNVLGYFVYHLPAAQKTAGQAAGILTIHLLASANEYSYNGVLGAEHPMIPPGRLQRRNRDKSIFINGNERIQQDNGEQCRVPDFIPPTFSLK